MPQHRNRFSPSDIKSGELRRLLERAGWESRTGRGSHTVLTKPGFANITLPARLKPNTWSTIERVLGVQIESMIDKRHGRHVVGLDEWRKRIELAGQLNSIGFGETYIHKHAGTAMLYDHGFRSDMVDKLGVQHIIETYVLPHTAASKSSVTQLTAPAAPSKPDPRKPGPVSIKVPAMRVIPATEAPAPTPSQPDTRLHWHYIGNPKTLCELPITRNGLRTQASKASEMAHALASTADTCAECQAEFDKWDAARTQFEDSIPRSLRDDQRAEADARRLTERVEEHEPTPEPITPIEREPVYTPPARSDDAVLELMGDIQSAINELPSIIEGAREAGVMRAQLAFARRRMQALRGSLHATLTELDAVLNVLSDSGEGAEDTR